MENTETTTREATMSATEPTDYGYWVMRYAKPRASHGSLDAQYAAWLAERSAS